MRTDRRGLLRIMGAALATAFGGRASALQPERRAPRIHSATENVLLGPVGERRPKLSSAPPNFKPYPGRQRMGLPAPAGYAGSPLPGVVLGRAPPFELEGGSLSALELARLLYFTNGVTGSAGGGKGSSELRAAPSAGAHYAGEVYVVAERVEGVPPGIYSYAVAEHELVQNREGTFANRVANAAKRPRPVWRAAAIVLLTCVFGRYTWRYANRGYRYALIDTGHISENLRLAATSAGIAEATELHFLDAELNELLGVDGRKEALCALHAVGRRSTRRRESFEKSRAMVELQSADRATLSPSGYVTDRYHQATTLLRPASGDTAARTLRNDQSGRRRHHGRRFGGSRTK